MFCQCPPSSDHCQSSAGYTISGISLGRFSGESVKAGSGVDETPRNYHVHCSVKPSWTKFVNFIRI